MGVTGLVLPGFYSFNLTEMEIFSEKGGGSPLIFGL